VNLEWDTKNTAVWLERVFDWLVRNRMGVAIRSRPIGWVQQHNMAAYNRIVELCEEKKLDVKKVRVWSGDLFVGETRLASCSEVYDYADRVGRSEKVMKLWILEEARVVYSGTQAGTRGCGLRNRANGLRAAQGAQLQRS
jgi:hypothetical protein